MMAYLKLPKNKLHGSNCNGAIVGWYKNNATAYEVFSRPNLVLTGLQMLSRWKDCAMHKECIAPEGSDVFNHRQDQAALTVLAHIYSMERRCVGWEAWDFKNPFDIVALQQDDEISELKE
jgi:hypothetical protein